jgi:hypothetical protein
MLFSISVSFTYKHVNHTVIFELKKLYKKNKKNKNIYTIMAFLGGGRLKLTIDKKWYIYDNRH